MVSHNDASHEETATSAYDSDASDLFHPEVEPAVTWETPQDKDIRVAHLLPAQMRRHPLLPPGANDDTGSTHLKLPAAHCTFRGCCWTGLSKNSIEEHVVLVHGAQLLAAEENVYGNKRQYGVVTTAEQAALCIEHGNRKATSATFFWAITDRLLLKWSVA